MKPRSLPIIAPSLQVAFFHRLQVVRRTSLQEGLREAVQKLSVSDIDRELEMFVSPEALSKLASFSVRGEAVFPVPCVLNASPMLLGYYRLLFGISQKEAYNKGPFGRFKRMEEKGLLSGSARAELPNLCHSLARTGEALVHGISPVSLQSLHELQVLTLGAQFRGSENVRIGAAAARTVFELFKVIARNSIQEATDRSLVLTNAAGRTVLIAVASDPDITITETTGEEVRPVVSIEIKGGADTSNVHNRIGEAEKSHQKARKQGFLEFWTILRSSVSEERARQESPTTSHFFYLDKILDASSDEAIRFRARLSSLLGIR